MPSFILDVHLGRLAKYLRLFGFDTVWKQSIDDLTLSLLAQTEDRILLSCDRALVHQHPGPKLLLSGKPVMQQLRAVFQAYNLIAFTHPFSRCLACNTPLEEVPLNEIVDQIDTATARYYDQFFICRQCVRVYWKGSHYQRMTTIVQEIQQEFGRRTAPPA